MKLIKKVKGGKTHEKISEEVKQYIKDKVDDDCTLSLKRITILVKEKYDLEISQTSAFKCLKKLHTLKNLRVYQRDEYCKLHHHKKRIYAERFMQIEKNYPDIHVF